MPRKISGAGVILCVGRDLVLLVRQTETRCWGFAKGRAENPQEPLIETAMREMREETGIEVRIGRTDRAVMFHPTSTRAYFQCGLRHVRDRSLARLLSLGPADCAEIAEIRWFHRSEWQALTRDDVNMDVWLWMHPTTHTTWVTPTQTHFPRVAPDK